MTTEQTTQVSNGTATTEQNGILQAAIAETAKNKTLTESAAEIMGVPAKSLLRFLRGVWTTSKGEAELTNEEMFIGISIVAKYHLDPVAREIYVTKSKGKLMTVIGIDGWIKILDRTPHYNGYEMEIHEDETGKVDYVTAIIHSKDRKYPAKYRAYAREYSSVSGFMAGKIPIHMLRIFALRHAARLFVPLGGTVMTDEEARVIEAGDNRSEQETPQEQVSIDDLIGATEKSPAEPPPEPTPEKKPPKKSTKTKTPPKTDDEAFEAANPPEGEGFVLEGGDK